MKKVISKILITVPTLEGGGMERAAINYAIAFNKLGYKVKIFTVSNNIIWFDVPKEIEVISGKKNTKDLWKVPLSLYRLRQVSIKFHPNIVLSFSGRMSSFICIALSGLAIPVIPFDRDNPTRSYGKFYDFLNSIVFPRCKAVVVQTEKAKQIFEKKFNLNSVIVVPNPIRKLNIDKVPKEKVIITLARLVDGKGIDKLIKIFSSINLQGWKLHILGDGYLMSDLENLVVKLNMEDKIKFLGFEKNVDTYLSRSSIFAFTSESEGYPNALLEAMCSGLACISFDCLAGPSDMITNGLNGFLVEMYNVIDYQKKLELLMKDKTLRDKFSNKALELNLSHDPDLIMKDFILQIEKLIV